MDSRWTHAGLFFMESVRTAEIRNRMMMPGNKNIIIEGSEKTE